MTLVSTNLKADCEKVHLAKLKGINLSQLFRDALDLSLKISGDEKGMLENQLAEIRKQIEILQLEERLVLDHLKTLESKDVVDQFRETKYNQRKTNIAYMIKNKTLDWELNRRLFRFSNVNDCKKWLTGKLENEGLI